MMKHNGGDASQAGGRQDLAPLRSILRFRIPIVHALKAAVARCAPSFFGHMGRGQVTNECILQERTAIQWANGLAYRLSMLWIGLQTKKRIPRVAEVPLSVRLKLQDVPAPSSTMSLSVGWPGWTCCSSQHQNQSRRQRGQAVVMNGSDKQLFD